MKKHDFYKELMSQYTFDEERIRKNARRASSASFLARNSKWLPLTAACLVVMVSATVILPFVLTGNEVGGNVLPPLPPVPAGVVVSDGDRIDVITHMEEALKTEGFTFEEKEMYISFEKPMTQEEFSAVLSALPPSAGTVELVALWNGGFVDAADANDMLFTAAKVIASDELYFELNACSEFSAIEVSSLSLMINDNNFRPIMNKAEFTDVPPPPETSEPSLTTPPYVSSDPYSDYPPLSVDIIGQELPIIEPFTETDPPQTVELPISDDFIDINIENAVSVDFISENKFILLTKSQIQFYEINTDEGEGYNCNAISGYVAANPSVVFTDITTGTLLILGGDAFGRRTELFIADSETGELIRLDTSDMDNITGAFFRNGEILIETQTAIYIASRHDGYEPHKTVEIAREAYHDYDADDPESFESTEFTEYTHHIRGGESVEIIEGANALVVLGFANGGFKYAALNDYNVQMYRFNTADRTSVKVDLGLENEGEIKFVHSPNARNFAIVTENGVYVWNATLSALSSYAIDVPYLRFHRYSGKFFTDNSGNWYILDGTHIGSISKEEVDELAPKPEFSSAYELFEITPDTIRLHVVN
ncbi:MAG: hypothetical protein FWG70_10885 [Oscillospiraceae bacterium]|nr:hypothetical protein [Oscillospiraceae bacterium]